MMIKALKPLLATDEVTLVIVGEGSERAALERMTERNGIRNQVSILGQVENVDALLAAADLLVHTSSVEGVPQVVIQALAAGKPVVATEVTGLREVERASLAVIPTSGAGLAAEVAARLECPPGPVDAQAFLPWTYNMIDVEIAAFHARFDA
jgi:glycosyltransferase involved in cell wall biosynthesis